MADGPGKYDPVCSAVRELTGASGAVVFIFDGVLGHGMSVLGPPEFHAQLPEVLRDVARQIEEEQRARVMAETGPGRFVRDPTDVRFVDAGEAISLVRELARMGITRKQIARRFGVSNFAITKARCTPRTLQRLRALHAAVARQVEVDRLAEEQRRREESYGEDLERGPCAACGCSHAPSERQAAIRRALPCEAAALREAHPCWWGGGLHSAGEVKLYRDLHAVGAVRVGEVWQVARERAA